jgi:hypothetical protein
VCKSGGSVSASCSSKSFPQFGCDSDCDFEGNDKIKELEKKSEEAYRKIYTQAELKQSEYWHAARYPKLFSQCGLKNISVHPYCSGFSYSDNYWSDEFKLYHIKTGYDRSIEMAENHKKDARFAEHGFSRHDCDELIKLYRGKQEYLLNRLHDNQDWEWNASTHYIVSGMKV